MLKPDREHLLGKADFCQHVVEREASFSSFQLTLRLQSWYSESKAKNHMSKISLLNKPAQQEIRLHIPVCICICICAVNLEYLDCYSLF